jgi:hypothetical protein
MKDLPGHASFWKLFVFHLPIRFDLYWILNDWHGLVPKDVFGKVDKFTSANWVLSLPYFFGFIPGILFYTETRFKIVSELLLVPLVVGAWSAVLSKEIC